MPPENGKTIITKAEVERLIAKLTITHDNLDELSKGSLSADDQRLFDYGTPENLDQRSQELCEQPQADSRSAKLFECKARLMRRAHELQELLDKQRLQEGEEALENAEKPREDGKMSYAEMAKHRKGNGRARTRGRD